MNIKQLLVLPLTVALLSACTATTSLRSSDPSLAVKINDDAPLVLKNPISKTYKATSFGQYRFRATQEGMEPMPPPGALAPPFCPPPDREQM